MAKRSGVNDDGAPMSQVLRLALISYQLAIGVLLIYGLVRLSTLEFPEMAVAIEAPPPAASLEGPPGPTLTDAFPHVRSGAVPNYEIALYGSGFVEHSQPRLNGVERVPKATPLPNLIQVVPLPGDLVGTGVLVIDVLNPDGSVSNALSLKIDRPKQPFGLLPRFAWNITYDTQLLLMVIFAGALGSLIHSVTSLADFIGNRTAITSWSWWYVSRPFLGSSLALIMYAVIRGGLLAGTPADAHVLNPFGAIAVAALVGMFADKATQKLADIFDTLFTSVDKRSGKLGAPAIHKLVPSTVPMGGTTAVDVRIVGDRLADAQTVKVDGEDRAAENTGDNEVVVKIQPEDMQAAGTLTIAVVTADGTSPTANLFVSDLAITTASLPDGQAAVDYPGATLAAAGGSGPYRWSMDAAASGLTLDKDGKVGGKPSTAGEVTLPVTVTDAIGASATREFRVQIK